MGVEIRFFYFYILLFGLIVLIDPVYGFDNETIRPGHTLKIIVSGHAEFSQTVVVKQDGTTEYPLLIGIPIDGLTVEDVKQLLYSALLKYEYEPEIYVILSDKRIIEYQVQGAVNAPGDFIQEAPINLQQAVLLAGGMAPFADPRSIHVLRLVNGMREDIEIDFYDYYLQDSLILAPEVFDGDIIVVSRATKREIVQVLGAVNAPGSFIPEPKENIYDIINRAGGFTESAKIKEVVYISYRNNKPVKNTVDLSDVHKAEKYEKLPLVKQGDIIVVYEIPYYTRLDWWARTIRDWTTILTAFFFLTGTFN